MRLGGDRFYNLLNPEISVQAADLGGQNLHAVAGIGHPERFFSHLEGLGLNVQAHPFPDHHCYTRKDLDYAGADAVLMTEKDAVKCGAIADEKCWVLRVDACCDPALTQLILERISPNGRQTA
ncbi:MAG: tetraacyldisaccharide 4'-kinase [Gallionellaceae bacterium]|nr:MAG: tetraacyldisaccharide 4'-kinase [Gallionellaceae bacterium]